MTRQACLVSRRLGMVGIGDALMCPRLTSGEAWRAGVCGGDVARGASIIAITAGLVWRGFDNGEQEEEEAELVSGIIGRR